MRKSVSSSASAHLKGGEEKPTCGVCVFVCKLAATLVNSNKINVHSSKFSCWCLNYV